MQPRPPQLLLAKGIEAYESERWDQVVSLLGEFCARYERHPRHAKMLKYLGIGQLRTGRNREAAETLARVVEGDPDDVTLREMLGHALRLGGRQREASNVYRRCLELGPENPVGTKAALAEVGLRLGRVDEAAGIMRACDEEGVVHPRLDLVRGMLALRSGEGRPAAIASLQRHPADDLADDLRPSVFSALGDLFDAEGRYDEAWAHYTIANETAPDAFNAAVLESWIGAVIKAWTPELVRRLQRWGDASERPVLIVGMPRSGTTMTEQLVARHPGVARGGELRALSDIVKGLPARIGGALPERAGALREPDVRASASAYLAAIDEVSPEAARVTDKMPMNLLQLGFFGAMFPRARVIHCRRDPRDNCLSCYCRVFFQDHPWTMRLDWYAAYYRQYQRLMDHWRAVLREVGAPAMLETRYEQVVRDPDGWAGRLHGFVGLAGDGAGGGQGVGDAPTLRADQVGKGIYTSSAGKHERYAAHLAPVYEGLAGEIEAYERGG